MKKVDDTFSVLHTHGVAGLVGGLMVGLLADPNMVEYVANPAAGKNAATVTVSGWFYGGGPTQLIHQGETALFVIALNIVGPSSS